MSIMKDNFVVLGTYEVELMGTTAELQNVVSSFQGETEKLQAGAACYEEFNHVTALNEDFTDVQVKPYVCGTCNEGFIHHEDYQRHCLTHNGERPHVCHICNKGFARKGNLKAHIKIHTGVKPFSCEVCKKGFSRKEDLLGHQVVHGDVYFCRVCNLRHTKDEAGEDCLLQNTIEMNSCEFCGKSFARKTNLKTHELSHMGEKPYICEICNKSFSRKEDLNGHVLSHSGINMYECEICSKGFNRKHNYELHRRKHDKICVFACEFCQKTFTKSTGLRNHMKTHESFGGPFRCKSCNKRFSPKAAFEVHCRTCYGEQGIENCDPRFNDSALQVTENYNLNDDDLRPFIVNIKEN